MKYPFLSQLTESRIWMDFSNDWMLSWFLPRKTLLPRLHCIFLQAKNIVCMFLLDFILLTFIIFSLLISPCHSVLTSWHNTWQLPHWKDSYDMPGHRNTTPRRSPAHHTSPQPFETILQMKGSKSACFVISPFLLFLTQYYLNNINL